MRAELKAIGAVRRTTTLYVTHDSVEALALGDRIGVIRAGRIVQTGTREEIWHQPYDTFVARSFGRPRINLLPGAVTEGGGFVSADRFFEIPPGATALPGVRALSPGTPVQVGVRPRDVSLGSRAPGPGTVELMGSVYITEALGRATEVTVRLGAQHLSLVAPRSEAAGLRPDAPVRLSVRSESLLLFEAEGAEGPGRPGRRITG
ncbi:TOBE domain-containing protein [Streptomyces sp. NPDC054887]